MALLPIPLSGTHGDNNFQGLIQSAEEGKVNPRQERRENRREPVLLGELPEPFTYPGRRSESLTLRDASLRAAD